jgi:cytochrome c oxidase subunit 4
MPGHVVPVRTYLLVFFALLVLTGITTGVAFVDLGPLNTVVALAIAVCKMLLVILFFMHVRYSGPLTKIVIVAAFFWLLILISLTLSDFRTRGWTPSPAGWGSASMSADRPRA